MVATVINHENLKHSKLLTTCVQEKEILNSKEKILLLLYFQLYLFCISLW